MSNEQPAQPLYKAIAIALGARSRCLTNHNLTWTDTWTYRLIAFRNQLPHGSGIDGGIHIEYDTTKPNQFQITFGFHHMNDHGFYTEWTEHVITVKPSFIYDFELKISGRDKNNIKDYLHDLFDSALREMVEV